MPDTFDDLSFDIDLTEDEPPEDSQQESADTVDGAEHVINVTHRMGHRQLIRRATSDQALESAIDWHFKEGDCYHCFSFGDVDFLSYVKFVARQQHINYLAMSTWCMAGEDVLEVQSWYEKGILDRCDYYVGEIFKGSYPEAYRAAVNFCRECGGRIVIFRNHAKIAIVCGDKFDCLIESSANINTNPRSENTVITVDKELTKEYLDLLNGVKSFDRSFDDIQPWERKQ